MKCSSSQFAHFVTNCLLYLQVVVKAYILIYCIRLAIHSCICLHTSTRTVYNTHENLVIATGYKKSLLTSLAIKHNAHVLMISYVRQPKVF